jgi:succinate dehydrogenase/fumarate reductase flavoprotein subunit
MRRQENRITTDVLVIGGGFAGVFAAVRAKEKGLDVTLVDKASVGRSGQTPWADSFHVFDEDKGCDKDDFRQKVAERGKYLNIEGFLDMLMDDSKSIFEELKEWGAVENAKFGKALHRKVKELGVQIIERTMLTHLIKQEERVIGSMGFPLDRDNEVYIINAKAVINCAGAGCYKAYGYPIQGLTFDGDAMSYRVGAEISGKEFNDFHRTLDEHPGSCWYSWGGKWGAGIYEENKIAGEKMTKTADGRDPHQSDFCDVSKGLLPLIPKGKPPLPKDYIEKYGIDENSRRPLGPPVPPVPEGVVPKNSPEVKLVGPNDPPEITRGGAAAGMSLHKAEGVFPKDGKATFESCVEGLFAAGDSLASMLGGTSYPGVGFSSSGSCVQGSRAGIAVAKYVENVESVEIDEKTIAQNVEEIFSARNREKGYDPRWVIQQLQNTMIPYYVLYVKEEGRLKNALHTILYLKENLAPKLMAKDNHGLMLAHETNNLLLNAEMRLRASLFRTESRGSHYREDYPEINEEQWTAWVVIKQDDDGSMGLKKVNSRQ